MMMNSIAHLCGGIRPIGIQYENISRESLGQIDDPQCLPLQFTPGPFDVICGRGKIARDHTGNQYFRQMIDNSLNRYKKAPSKVGKTHIVSEIIKAVQANAVPLHVGFVRRVNGRWYKAPESMVREKIGQCFRDRLHDKYKSSSRKKFAARRKILSREKSKLTPSKNKSKSSLPRSRASHTTFKFQPASSKHGHGDYKGLHRNSWALLYGIQNYWSPLAGRSNIIPPCMKSPVPLGVLSLSGSLNLSHVDATKEESTVKRSLSLETDAGEGAEHMKKMDKTLSRTNADLDICLSDQLPDASDCCLEELVEVHIDDQLVDEERLGRLNFERSEHWI